MIRQKTGRATEAIRAGDIVEVVEGFNGTTVRKWYPPYTTTKEPHIHLWRWTDAQEGVKCCRCSLFVARQRLLEEGYPTLRGELTVLRHLHGDGEWA